MKQLKIRNRKTNTMRLVRIFNRVKQTSRNLRINNPNADGRQFWQFIKTTLGDYPICASKGWISQEKNLTENLMAIEETCEVNHFIRQHANIPCKEPPTLTKIIQIALNAGQLSGTIRVNEQHQIMDRYHEAKLDDIRTYICEEDIVELSAVIPDELEMILVEYLCKY